MSKIASRTRSDVVAITGVSNGPAVHGETTSGNQAPGVSGLAANERGSGAGVLGITAGSGAGIVGLGGDGGLGAFFKSDGRSSLVCEGKSPNEATVAIFHKNPTGGEALHVEHIADQTAAFFKGNVIVTGDISFPGADCAEDFQVAALDEAEPGTVMTIAHDGRLACASIPYDRKVAGVVAGAGGLRPGIVLGRVQGSGESKLPVALAGRVFCKVDARHGAIEVGDLLTTSETPGHAMKVTDYARALGAVIGKAMAAHREGTGAIPILVALQ